MHTLTKKLLPRVQICKNVTIFYDKDGNEYWYSKPLTGKVTHKIHNNTGPAVITFRNAKVYKESYFENGKRHREDGPSIIEYKENMSIPRGYHINGKKFSEEEFNKEILKKKLNIL